MTPDQIVTEARSLLGTEWKHQGRTTDGIDCVGLVVVAYLRCGWEPKNPANTLKTNYERVATTSDVLDTMREEGEEVAREDLQPGDVAVFKYEEHEFAQHCGIISRKRANGDLYFIHADSDVGKVIEHRLVLVWRERFVAGFRMVGAE